VVRAGLTIRGAPTNVRRGLFLILVAMIISGGARFPKELTFLGGVVTFKPNVETAWYKNFAVDRGALPWYNRDTMVNPALQVVKNCEILARFSTPGALTKCWLPNG